MSGSRRPNGAVNGGEREERMNPHVVQPEDVQQLPHHRRHQHG